MRSYVYRSPSGKQLEPIAIVYGDIAGKSDVLVRVHDQCFTSEVMGSLRCDCREQLEKSMEMIREQGGVIIYLQQEGRGIGLANKIAAYALQDDGLDTVDANLRLGFKEDQRDYTVIPDIIKDLQISSMKLITNNPFKVNQMLGLGVRISSQVPIHIKPGLFNRKYLKAKRERMMHNLNSAHFEDTMQSDPVVAAVGGALPAELSFSPEEMQRRRRYVFGRESVEAAISAVKRGEIVVVVDDEDRENEGDLILAAEKSTPENIGFVVRHTSGVLCVSLEKNRLDVS
jgi:GTP cyclohydrolase II